MPVKKKKKSKSKASVRKARASQKKRAKPAKKKVSKIKAAPKKKKVLKPSTQKRVQVPKGKLVWEVIHYFPHVEAAVVKVKVPRLQLGDSLHFKGHTTDFPLKLESMQIDHKPIQEARKGDEVGVRVPNRVREGDRVYRVAG